MSSQEARIQQLEFLVQQLSEQLSITNTALSSSQQQSNHQLPSRYLQSGGNGSQLNDGDTAWMLASCALVLFMTMPGLALYYSGMCRTKNVLATVMQTFTITCVITFLWLCFGYSLSFGPSSPPVEGTSLYQVIGSSDRMWLFGLTVNGSNYLAPTIPETVFCMYQLTFAIITAALIAGSFAERMKFLPMIAFISLWHLLVYCPVAHSVWHPDGFLFKAGALDYAGGNVVHICSGISGLIAAIVLGKRQGFGKERFDPHNILMTFMGMCMLWVGWFGFNAGSAVSATGRAGYAMLNTQISTAIASLTWMMTDWYWNGQPSVLGMISGAVAGLVSITPACGYVDQTAAFIIGLLAGPICFFGAILKHYLGYDDALDAFGVHAVGGIFGGIATGFFVNPNITGSLAGVFYTGVHTGGHQLASQLYAIVVTVGWSAFMTFIILKLLDVSMGLRVSLKDEVVGLDVSIHGESVGQNEHSFIDKKSSSDHLSLPTITSRDNIELVERGNSH